MDPRHPTTFTCPEWEQSKQLGGMHYASHTVLDGEGLELERARDGDCRFPFTPWESGLIVSVCLIALGAAFWAANAAQGVPA